MLALHVIEQHVESNKFDFRIEFLKKVRVARARFDNVLIRRTADRTDQAIKTFTRRFVLTNGHLLGMCLRQVPMDLATLALKIAVRTLHKRFQILDFKLMRRG